MKVNIDKISFESNDESNINVSLKESNELESNQSKKKSNDKGGIMDDCIYNNVSDEWSSILLSKDFYIQKFLNEQSIHDIINNSGKYTKMNHIKLRNMVIKYINSIDNTDFFNIINDYRKKLNLKSDIKNKRDFIKELRGKNFKFENDEITLSLISKVIEVDFITMKKNDNKYEINYIHNDGNNKIIILYIHDNQNNLVCLKLKDKFKSIFKKQKLPSELEILLDKQLFFKKHLYSICENKCKELHLNDIIRTLENNIHSLLSKEDKKYIMLLIKNWLKI